MSGLGLTPHAESVYRVALDEVTWDEGALVQDCTARTGLTREQVLTGLAELLALELLRPASTQSEGRLRVVAPDVVLEARLEASRRDLLEGQRQVERAARQLLELQAAHQKARAAEVEHTVERLVGLDAVRGRLEQLARGARQEALSFMRGPQDAESMEASWPLDREALERGVALRSIYLHSCLNDTAVVAYLRRIEQAGGETRTVPTLPLQLLVVDRAVAVIPMDAERSSAGALVVHSQGAVTALLALFESVWHTARTLGEPRRTVVAELSDTEREILRILAAGATDEVVARHLAVSVRTVRRLTAVLMERFSARSRFELGVKLGQQGWDVGGRLSRG